MTIHGVLSHVEESSPEPAPEPPPPERPPWRFEPDDILPCTAALDMVIGRGSDIVVGLYGARVYPSGIALRLGVWWRSANKNQILNEFIGIPPERMGMHRKEQSRLLWGFEFGDGRKVTNADPYPYPKGPAGRFDANMHAREADVGPPDVPVLTAGHGSSAPDSGHGYQNYWLWPLPPPGTLRIACEWTSRGIEETVTEIDAAPVVEAAGRAQPVWP